MADPTIFSASFVDDAGVRATALDYVSYDGALTTVNDLLDAALAWGTLVDPLSDAQCTSVTVSITQTGVPGAKSAPVADSTVERTALFSFHQAGSVHISSTDIPGFANSIITNGRVDLTNSAVIAFINYMQNATQPFAPQSVAGRAILAFMHVVLSFRKRRKQRIKTSFETT